MLQGLIELKLEQIDRFVLAISITVKTTHEQLVGNKNLHNHTDKTWNNYQTDHLVSETESSKRIINWLNEVKNVVNKASVDGLSYDIFYQQWPQTISFSSMSFQRWQNINGITQEEVDNIHQSSHNSNNKQIRLPCPQILHAQQCSKRYHKEHEQNNRGIDDIFSSLLVTHLHIVPVDIIRITSFMNNKRFFIDFQKITVYWIHLQKVFLIMLVLKRNKSLASEMRKLKGWSVIHGKFVAKVHVLSINKVNLIGNVLNLIRMHFRSALLIHFDTLIDHLIPKIIHILHFSKIVTQSNTSHNFIFSDSLLILMINKLPKIPFKIVQNLVWI